MCNSSIGLLVKYSAKFRKIKEVINKNVIISTGICYCKQEFINRYIGAIGSMFIDVVSYVENNINKRSEIEIEEKVQEITNLFKQRVYNELYMKEDFSKHMLALLEALQIPIEEKMFERVDLDLLYASTQPKSRIDSALESLFEQVYKWTEVTILNVSGMRINCNNISDEVFSFVGKQSDRFCLASRCANCQTDKCHDCKFSCPQHTITEATGDCIHLFLVDEYLELSDWMLYYGKLIKKCHLSGNVNIIIDYKLASPFAWAEDNYDRFHFGKNLFPGNTFEYVNYDHIDFNIYREKIKEHLREVK